MAKYKKKIAKGQENDQGRKQMKSTATIGIRTPISLKCENQTKDQPVQDHRLKKIKKKYKYQKKMKKSKKKIKKSEKKNKKIVEKDQKNQENIMKNDPQVPSSLRYL